MSYKLLEDVIVEINGNICVMPVGTIISEVAIDFDQEQGQEQDTDKMLSIVQGWIDKFKPQFTDEGWTKIIGFLQPALDAIHSGDVQLLKSATVDIANKSERLAKTNPQSKNALDQIHSLYTKLLGVARGIFGESINDLITIIKESTEKIKLID